MKITREEFISMQEESFARFLAMGAGVDDARYCSFCMIFNRLNNKITKRSLSVFADNYGDFKMGKINADTFVTNLVEYINKDN